MTLLIFSNFYAEEFSLNDIAVNLALQLVGSEMKKVSWGGNLIFEEPGGEIEGGIQILTHRQGGTNPSSLVQPVLMLYSQMFWHRLTGKSAGGVVPPPKLFGVWPWNFYQMSISMGRCKICKKIEISNLVCKLWSAKFQNAKTARF